MRDLNILIMYICAALTTCVMYATQPLGPLFSEILEISKFQASLFTTAILAPLSVAGIVYGYILERFSIKKILIISFFSFGILELIFSACQSYFSLLSIRAAQGLLAPAALTGIMSYISQHSTPQLVAQNIGKYVGITVSGGFFGRFFSGLSSDIFGSWRVFFVIIGLLLLVATFFLTKINESQNSAFAKPHFSDITHVFSVRKNRLIYFYIFCAFFVLQAVLNFVPFELRKLTQNFSGAKTGLLYLGFLFGVIISFNAKKITLAFGSAPRAMMCGALIFIVGVLGLNVLNVAFMLGAMIVVCIGNFITHAIASGYLNTTQTTHKPIANGLYVSFYYLGGTLGSFAPQIIYQNASWAIFLAILAVILSFCVLFAVMLQKINVEANL